MYEPESLKRANQLSREKEERIRLRDEEVRKEIERIVNLKKENIIKKSIGLKLAIEKAEENLQKKITGTFFD